MNCGLRVDNYFHFRGRQVKESACLDDFKALVHESSRINCDAAAHLPRWMVERLLDGNRCKFRARGVEKRPAGSCKPDALDFLHAAAAETLVDGVVFAVDGKQRLAL